MNSTPVEPLYYRAPLETVVWHCMEVLMYCRPLVSSKVHTIEHCRMPVAVLCGGTMGIDTLNKLCYTIYMKLCSSSKSTVLPDELPPKHRAVYYHCLCAHLWVIQYTEDVDPCDLGMAVFVTKWTRAYHYRPAPDDLLKVGLIRCRCKTTSINTCFLIHFPD